MVNLNDTSSLDISFDVANNKVFYGEHIKHGQAQKVPLKKLLPALLNKSLSYPEEVYEEHNRVFDEHDDFLAETELSYDLMCLPAGLLGIEFMKTHIFYAPQVSTEQKWSSMVEVHYGILTIILQKNAPKSEYDFETNVAEGIIVKLKLGEKFVIPQGYFYTFINTEEQPVLFVRIYKKNNGIVDYNLLRRERGMAYYCIRKNARQEIVLNPLYRNTPEIKYFKQYTFDLGVEFDLSKSLYSLLRENTALLDQYLYC